MRIFGRIIFASHSQEDHASHGSIEQPETTISGAEQRMAEAKQYLQS